MASSFAEVDTTESDTESVSDRSSVHYDLSEKDDWQTPPDLIADLNEAVGGIDIDPCAHENTAHGDVNFRLEDGDDGLEDSWVDAVDSDGGVAFVNPPFSYKKDWLETAVEEVQNGLDTVIFLTPDGTDTKSWWHQYIATYSTYCCFCEGRIAFYDDGEEGSTPPFGTVLTVFGECPDELLSTLQEWGHVVETV